MDTLKELGVPYKEVVGNDKKPLGLDSKGKNEKPLGIGDDKVKTGWGSFKFK